MNAYLISLLTEKPIAFYVMMGALILLAYVFGSWTCLRINGRAALKSGRCFCRDDILIDQDGNL